MGIFAATAASATLAEQLPIDKDIATEKSISDIEYAILINLISGLSRHKLLEKSFGPANAGFFWWGEVRIPISAKTQAQMLNSPCCFTSRASLLCTTAIWGKKKSHEDSVEGGN